MSENDAKRKRVLRSLLIARPGAIVWEILGDFRRPQSWLPGIGHVEITETTPGRLHRRCATRLGEFRESLLDSGPFWQIYAMDRSPIPIREYRALLAVKALGESSCGLLWAASFSPSSTAETASRDPIEKIFDAGLSRIAKLFPAQPDAADSWRHWDFPLDRIGWHN